MSKSNIFIVVRHKALCGILAVLILCEMIFCVVLCVKYFSQDTHSLIDYTIVIDAGHGGVDGGVVGLGGTKESDINLVYSKTLAEKFVTRGFKVVLTRETEDGLYGLATNGFKRRDMQARKKTIADCNADIVISVHMNKYSNRMRSGAQVFFVSDSERDKKLADNVQIALNSINSRTYSAIAGDFYMCRCTPNPSIIVECGFLSNPQEEQLLLMEAHRVKITDAIFDGVMLFLYKE
ncbi:MAG: N-acetylmuramoyl-L-alanine amidase [Clostridia bacterium]